MIFKWWVLHYSIIENLGEVELALKIGGRKRIFPIKENGSEEIMLGNGFIITSSIEKLKLNLKSGNSFDVIKNLRFYMGVYKV